MEEKALEEDETDVMDAFTDEPTGATQEVYNKKGAEGTAATAPK